jgi:hypothetical protein
MASELYRQQANHASPWLTKEICARDAVPRATIVITCTATGDGGGGAFRTKRVPCAKLARHNGSVTTLAYAKYTEVARRGTWLSRTSGARSRAPGV